MKLIITVIFLILIGIAFWWMAGAIPSDQEVDQWEMSKIDKELHRYDN